MALVASNSPNALCAYASDFRGEVWVQFVRTHAEIPVLAVCLYFALVFYAPALLAHRPALNLKTPLAAWNLCLAVFSALGAAGTVPHLASALRAHGFTATVCRHPQEWYLDGRVGLCVALFILSKVPELLDTAFLVLQKKPVIFLHWFHHVTVMLYCWHAFHNRIATGLWFAAMNFSVHAVMYTYYFLMAVGCTRVVRPVAPVVTTLQILQMAVGSYVTLHAAAEYYRHGAAACAVDPANFKLGLAMYGSYMLLFCVLFGRKYLAVGGGGGGGEGEGGGEGGGARETLCGVDVPARHVDAAGRFAGGVVGTGSARPHAE